MDVRLASFASELVKVAAEKKKSPGYLGAVAASAPYAAVTALSDVPEGWLEKAVQQTLLGTPAARREASWARGVGAGLGRLGPGLLTAPVFLSGLRDLQEGKDKKKGYAKIVGAGVAMSAGKGYTQAAIEKLLGASEDVAASPKRLAAARAVMGAASAALLAHTVAGATKKVKGEKENKKAFLRKHVTPVLVGAGLGSGKGAFEELVSRAGKKVNPRAVAARAGGKAAAGALGALAITEAVRRLMPAKEKKAEATPVPDLGPTAGELYTQTKEWAGGQNEADAYKLLREIAEGGAERSPSRRAAYYALYDDLKARGMDVPAPTMRGEVSGKTPPMRVAEVLALAAIPTTPAVAALAVNQLPGSERDRVLTDAMDRLYIQGKIRKAPPAEFPGIWEALKKLSQGEVPMWGTMADVGANRIHVAPDAPSGILAHELGHMTAGPTRRELMSPIAQWGSMLGAFFSVAIPLLAVEGARDGSFTTPQELESKAHLITAAGALTGAAQLPTLAEETIANVKATKLLRGAGASKAEALARVVGHAGPGYLSYLAPAALPFIAAGYLKHKARKKEAE